MNQDLNQDLSEPKRNEDEIFTSVSDKILDALKDFNFDDKHPGQVKTDKLQDFLDYCDFKMDQQSIYMIQSELDPSHSGFLDGVALKNLIIS